jgi:hypothetical protein
LRIGPEFFERGDSVTVSMLRDAAMVLPEITELAAAVIHEDAVLIDAEVDLCWLREVLSNPCKSVLSDQNAKSLQFQADYFTALLKRAATTEPKTAREHAIKARIVGEAPEIAEALRAAQAGEGHLSVDIEAIVAKS